jgi:glucokinase
VLCVDLGGTKTYIAKGRQDGELEEIRRFTIDFTDQATVVRQLFDFIDLYLLENCGNRSLIKAIGIGLKGYADRREGIWKSCLTIPNFTPINISELAINKFGIPTVIDNDVRAATLAELYFGAGKQYKDFIYYNIGTGIAVGIVSDSRLVRGSTYYAGEYCQLITEPDENLSEGGVGVYLEKTASGAAILRQVKYALNDYPNSQLAHFYDTGTLTSHTVFTLAERGDELAEKITKRVLNSIQRSVVVLTDLLNPDAIIFGGGVVADGLLIPYIKDYVYKHALKPSASALKDIRLTNLGADIVGILGANAIGWEESLTSK